MEVLWRSKVSRKIGLVLLLGIGNGCPDSPAYQVLGPAESSNYGVNPSYAPAYDVLVDVGSLNQSLIDAHPQGTRFALKAGVHRLSSSLKPLNKQQFLGFPGAVINGSKPVTSWRKEGSFWVADGQTQRLPESTHGAEAPLSQKTEDAFYDDKPLFQVDSTSKLTSGKFYFDYTNSRIYLADDPNGHKVETTVTQQAFNGGGTDVVIKNLVIEKFGNKAQTAAVSSSDIAGWVIENCDIRFNHGVGVKADYNARVRGNKIHHNGQLGIAGAGDGIIVEGNEIAYNNINGYNSYWEAGGSKWVFTNGLIVRKNWAHHNYGPGLWTDIDNKGTLFEDNIAEYNERSGIMHEISYDAIIRRNTLRGNGTNWKYWEVEGAGINISNSSGVEAYGNTVENNASGIVIRYDIRDNYDAANNYIHDNIIKMTGGSALFLSPPQQIKQKNNRFENNRVIQDAPTSATPQGISRP